MRCYNLDDFGEPPYRDGNGQCIEHVRSAHHGLPTFQAEGAFGLEYVWFIHIENESIFDFYLYDAKFLGPGTEVRTVDPFVLIHGATDEGVRACWFSDTEPSNLSRMANALLLADDEIKRRGWTP